MNNNTSKLFFNIFFFGAIFIMMYITFFRKNLEERMAEQLGNIVLGLMALAVIAKYADKIFPKRFKKN